MTLTVFKVFALLVFFSGFLLARFEISERSSCADFPAERAAAHDDCSLHEIKSVEGTCWIESPVQKIVLLIIDGARFDFAVSKSRTDPSHHRVQERYSLNSIPEIIDEAQGAAELYRFVADPPTTTQQRLKGLLTGGLPTFIEVGNSFGASELVEDNIIAQAAAAGRRIALSGDDTWLELFRPEHFAAGISVYPSFNVRDLDSVDHGVRQHLTSSLQHPDQWDMLIGHFLGVDHAGHTFGVESSAMARKLEEYDADIRTMIAAMKADQSFNSTLLIVMGDHGMTKNGDHGGCTAEETDSFVLVLHPWANADVGGWIDHSELFSPRRTFQEEYESMPQVNFAPTIALIFGLPIPFGSVGYVPRRFWEIANANPMNSLSDSKSCATMGFTNVSERIEEQYYHVLKVTSAQVWRYLHHYAGATSNHFSIADWSLLSDLYDSANKENISSRVATKHLMNFMHTAAKIARGRWIHFRLVNIVFGITLLALSISVQSLALRIYRSNFLSPSSDLVGRRCIKKVVSFTNSLDILDQDELRRMRSLEPLSTSLLMALGLCSKFSNSFIDAEADVAHFFFASFVFLLTVKSCSSAGLLCYTRSGRFGGAVAATGLMLCNFTSRNLCASWAKSVHNVAGKQSQIELNRISAYVYPHGSLAIACVLAPLALLPFVIHCAIGPIYRGIFRFIIANSLTAVGVKYLFLGKALQNAFGLLSSNAYGLLSLAGTTFPFKFVYMASFVLFSFTLITAFRARSVNAAVFGVSNSTLVTLVPALIMISGNQGFIWSFLALTEFAFLSLALRSDIPVFSSTDIPRELTLTCFLLVLNMQLFAASGHRNAFDGLHFDRAFTGFTEFNLILMATILAVNTWSSDIVAAFFLPVAAALLLAQSREKISTFHISFRKALARLALSYGLLRAIGILSGSIFVAVERHHLMLWATFAPMITIQAFGFLFSEFLTIFILSIGLTVCG
jgi:phosphatidylinositol glycan class O